MHVRDTAVPRFGAGTGLGDDDLGPIPDVPGARATLIRITPTKVISLRVPDGG